MSKKTHLCKTSTHTLFRAFLSRASSSLFGPPPGWSACLRHTLSRLFSFPPDSSGPLAGRSTGQGRVACTARPAEQRILLLFDSVEEQEDLQAAGAPPSCLQNRRLQHRFLRGPHTSRAKADDVNHLPGQQRHRCGSDQGQTSECSAPQIHDVLGPDLSRHIITFPRMACLSVPLDP